ncbi:MAG: helix-turn-helix transcriptional regulator [Acidimicrobiales bacterium]
MAGGALASHTEVVGWPTSDVGPYPHQLGGWRDRGVGMGQELIGREAELAQLARLLDGAGPSRGVVLSGQAGAGKTVLLRATGAQAAARGFMVLSTVASPAESRLSYASLADLIGGVLDDVLDNLPRPQANALQVALLRTSGGPVDARTVYVGFLAVLRCLASRSAVLVSVDDLQWVDATSARGLAFAFRRLGPEPVVLTATRRVGEPSPAGAAAMGDTVTTLNVGPLGRDVLARVVRSADGSLPLPLVYRLCQVAAGNPLVALELLGAVRRLPVLPLADESLPVPEEIGALVRERLSHLGRGARQLLLLAAACPQPRLSAVCRAFGEPNLAGEALDELRAAGVVAVDGDRVQFGHPLFGSICYSDAVPAQRADAHRRLACGSSDAEDRGRHLALAAEGPDAGVAGLLEEASAAASLRGAPDAAAELLGLALRMTPPDRLTDTARRMVAAGNAVMRAGDWPGARKLLRAGAEKAPSPELRAQALLTLAWGTYRDDGPVLARKILNDARVAAADGPVPLKAAVYRALAWMDLVGGSLEEGSRLARTGVVLAEQVGADEVVSDALTAFCMAEFARGNGLNEALLERACALRVAVDPCNAAVWAGVLHMWAGDHGRARVLVETLAEARHLGDETVAASASYWLAELDWRCGNWDAAERYLGDWTSLAQTGGARLARSLALAVHAYLLAATGDTAGARTSATEALALAGGTDNRHPVALSKAALGFVELTAGDFVAAADALDGLGELLDRDGVVDPGIYLFAADEVEACLNAGRRGRAVARAAWLRAAADRTGRPWGIAIAARCEGLLAGAAGDLPTAVARLSEALTAHAAVGMPFERGRTLLLLGVAQRRAKRRGDARRSLAEAVAVFTELGACPWAARAAGESQRIGGRRPVGAGELTPAENRVAVLAASGLRNREISHSLFISEKTVDSTLSHVYVKLGIRSRTELARLIEQRSEPGGP